MRVSRAVPCALALAAATVLSGCLAATNGMGTPLPTVSRFSIHWQNYSQLEPNKAMAIAGDVIAVFVSGYVSASSDPKTSGGTGNSWEWRPENRKCADGSLGEFGSC